MIPGLGEKAKNFSFLTTGDLRELLENLKYSEFIGEYQRPEKTMAEVLALTELATSICTSLRSLAAKKDIILVDSKEEILGFMTKSFKSSEEYMFNAIRLFTFMMGVDLAIWYHQNQTIIPG